MDILNVRLTGNAPLVMRNGRLADPLDEVTIEIARIAAKRKKTQADHERLGELEFIGGLWTDRGRPCIRADALEAAICEAAAKRRARALFRSSLVVQANPIVEHPGAQDLDALRRDPAYRLRVGVGVNGKRVMRTRPMFTSWAANATIGYLKTVIGRRDLLEVLSSAGDLVGLGDFRPRYGRFAVAEIDDVAANKVPGAADHG